MTTNTDTITTIAGDDGYAVAGHFGTAKAGDRGTAIVGGGGKAIVGDCGTAIAGKYGRAEAGICGRAMVGNGGTICLLQSDGVAKVGVVGREIESGRLYRLDSHGNFVLADDEAD